MSLIDDYWKAIEMRVARDCDHDCSECVLGWTRMRERLQMIADLAIDYDGYRTAEDLMSLIDEIREIALNGIPEEANDAAD